MEETEGRDVGILLGAKELDGFQLGFSDGALDSDGDKLPSIVGLAEIEG